MAVPTLANKELRSEESPASPEVGTMAGAAAAGAAELLATEVVIPILKSF